MHILSPETDNCPSWISGRERMTVENISWSVSTKEYCRPRRGLNPRPPGLQSDGASNWATEAGPRIEWFSTKRKLKCQYKLTYWPVALTFAFNIHKVRSTVHFRHCSKQVLHSTWNKKSLTYKGITCCYNSKPTNILIRRSKPQVTLVGLYYLVFEKL